MFTPIQNTWLKGFQDDCSQAKYRQTFTDRHLLIPIKIFMHSNLFIHTHKGSLTKNVMVKPVLMKMYKQIRKFDF